MSHKLLGICRSALGSERTRGPSTHPIGDYAARRQVYR